MRIRTKCVTDSKHVRGPAGKKKRSQTAIAHRQARRIGNAKSGKDADHTAGGHTTAFGPPATVAATAKAKLCACGKRKATKKKPCECVCDDCGTAGHHSKAQHSLCPKGNSARKAGKKGPETQPSPAAPAPATWQGAFAGW